MAVSGEYTSGILQKEINYNNIYLLLLTNI